MAIPSKTLPPNGKLLFQDRTPRAEMNMCAPQLLTITSRQPPSRHLPLFPVIIFPFQMHFPTHSPTYTTSPGDPLKGIGKCGINMNLLLHHHPVLYSTAACSCAIWCCCRSEVVQLENKSHYIFGREITDQKFLIEFSYLYQIPWYGGGG